MSDSENDCNYCSKYGYGGGCTNDCPTRMVTKINMKMYFKNEKINEKFGEIIASVKKENKCVCEKLIDEIQINKEMKNDEEITNENCKKILALNKGSKKKEKCKELINEIKSLYDDIISLKSDLEELYVNKEYSACW